MKRIKLPPYQEFELTNGMQVIIMESPELPLVNFRLLVRSGISSEPVHKEGLARIFMKILKRGTGKKSGNTVAEEIDFLGGSIEPGVSYDFASITGEFLSRDFRKGFNLFSQLVLNPSFHVSELEKLKKKTIAEIITLSDIPSALCDINYKRFLFGDHPYAKNALGKIRDIMSVSGQDLADFYSEHFNPGNFILFIGGDITAKRAMKTVEKEFNTVKQNGRRRRAGSNPRKVNGKKILIVNKPDLTQTQLRIGNLGIQKKNPDLFKIIVANNILGGSFGSRLVQKIRVEKGLTYGIKSFFNTMLNKGDFTISTFTKNETVSEVIGLVLSEMIGMKEKTVSREELLKSKTYLCGLFPLGLETTGLKL